MDYKTIRRMVDTTKPWRGTQDYPWDNRKHTTKRMRVLGDGSIEVAYQGVPFVTYHPDGQVTMKGFSGPQQQNVFCRMLPNGVIFDEACRVGSSILVCPHSQFRTDRSWLWGRFPYWIAKDKTKECNWGNRKANPDVHVYRCDKPVRLYYCAAEDRYVAVDQAELQPFEWRELDRKKTRKLNEEWRLTDFEAFLRARQTLIGAGDLPEYSETVDDVLLDTIKSGDFMLALSRFPRGSAYLRRYRWRLGYISPDDLPTMAYFNDLRTLLYKRENALIERSEPMLTLPYYKRIQSLLYRFR